MEDELTCEICKNEFHSTNRIPKILPCGHCFCDRCIQKLCTNQSTSISCPKCRKECRIPTDGFATVFTLCDVIRKMELQSKNADANKIEHKCGNCGALKKITKMLYCAECYGGDRDKTGLLTNWLCHQCMLKHATHVHFTYNEMKKMNEEAKHEMCIDRRHIDTVGDDIDSTIQRCLKSIQEIQKLKNEEFVRYNMNRTQQLSKFDENCLMSSNGIDKLRQQMVMSEKSTSDALQYIVKGIAPVDKMLATIKEQSSHTTKPEYPQIPPKVFKSIQQRNNIENPLSPNIIISLRYLMTIQTNSTEQKLAISNSGAIEMVMNQINRQLVRKMFDSEMKSAWEYLWNITDDSLSACDRFINNGGLRLFDRCFRTCTDQELQLCMMGPIGNAAECKQLRAHYINDEYIKLFREIMTDKNHSISPRFRAAKILAHLLSDDDNRNWFNTKISYNQIEHEISQTLDFWNIDTKLSINYANFKPFFEIMSSNSTVCKYFALWALASLTTTESSYCRLIEGDDIMNQLKLLTGHKDTKIKRLAIIVTENIDDIDCLPLRLHTRNPTQELFMSSLFRYSRR